MYQYRTNTRWGLMTLPQLRLAQELSIDDVVIVPGQPWWFYRQPGGAWVSMRGHDYAFRAAA